MRITKADLKEMILEALGDEDLSGDDLRLKGGSVSAHAAASTARDRIMRSGEELTGTEQNLIQQIQDYITRMATLPGVDLAQHRTLLQRILELIQSRVAPNVKSQDTTQGTQE